MTEFIYDFEIICLFLSLINCDFCRYTRALVINTDTNELRRYIKPSKEDKNSIHKTYRQINKHTGKPNISVYDNEYRHFFKLSTFY